MYADLGHVTGASRDIRGEVEEIGIVRKAFEDWKGLEPTWSSDGRLAALHHGRGGGGSQVGFWVELIDI